MIRPEKYTIIPFSELHASCQVAIFRKNSRLQTKCLFINKIQQNRRISSLLRGLCGIQTIMTGGSFLSILSLLLASITRCLGDGMEIGGMSIAKFPISIFILFIMNNLKDAPFKSYSGAQRAQNCSSVGPIFLAGGQGTSAVEAYASEDQPNCRQSNNLSCLPNYRLHPRSSYAQAEILCARGARF